MANRGLAACIEAVGNDYGRLDTRERGIIAFTFFFCQTKRFLEESGFDAEEFDRLLTVDVLCHCGFSIRADPRDSVPRSCPTCDRPLGWSTFLGAVRAAKESAE